MDNRRIPLPQNDPYLPRGAQFRTNPNRSQRKPGAQCAPDNVNRADVIIRCIRSGHKVMVIMRGLPGSGKSTLARKLQPVEDLILSTDKMFVTRNGEYSFDRDKIEEAHRQNLQLAILAMESKRTPIIIDNTNIEVWEMQKYVKPGIVRGYEIYFLVPDTPWAWNVKECAIRNSHGVPLKSIKRMSINYEKCSVSSFFQNASRNTNQVNMLGVNLGGPNIDDFNLDENLEAQNTEKPLLRTPSSSPEPPFEDALSDWTLEDPSAWGLPTPGPLAQRKSKLLGSGAEKNDQNESKFENLQENDEKMEKLLENDEKVEKLAENDEKVEKLPEKVEKLPENDEKVETLHENSCKMEPLKTKNKGKRKPKPPTALGSALMANNAWKLPDYLSTSVGKNELVENEVIGDFSLLPDKPFPVTVHERQTHVCDQLLLLNSGFHTRMQVEDVADTINSNIVEKNRSIEQKSIGVQCDLEEEEGLMPYAVTPSVQKLCQLFRGILPDNMTHILNQVEGDVCLAVNVLLDCGFLYSLENVFLRSRMSSESPEPDPEPQESEVNSTDLGFVESSSSVDESGNEEPDENLVLELGPKLAKYLEELFGPVNKDGIPSDMLSPEMLRVRLPLEFAAQMHSFWLETMRKPVNEAQFKNGFEASAYTAPSSLMSSERCLTVDHALAQILQQQQDEAIAKALSLSDYMYDSSHFPQLQQDTMASKLKYTKLTEAFPSVDPIMLKEIFQENKFNHDHTKNCLIQLGHNEVKSGAKIEQVSEPAIIDDEDEDFDSMEYENIRHKAIQFNLQKKRNFEKAQKYFKEGNKSTASYYSQMGHKFHAKEKRANAAVASYILKKRDCDTTLDLHGLHVGEATSAISTFLKKHDRPVALRSGGTGRQLKVITGQGRHSLNGPKIKPAVVGFLKQCGYRFEEQSAGILKVWTK